MERAEVGDADVEELADFEAAFVVGEHGGVELGGGGEDLGFDAEDLADHDTGDEVGVDDCGMVVGIGPFGDGDGLGGAVEQVVGGFVVSGQPLIEEDIVGGIDQVHGDEQVFGIDAGCFPGSVLTGRVLDQQRLFEHGVADGSPFGCIQGQRCAGWRGRRRWWSVWR